MSNEECEKAFKEYLEWRRDQVDPTLLTAWQFQQAKIDDAKKSYNYLMKQHLEFDHRIARLEELLREVRGELIDWMLIEKIDKEIGIK